MPFLVHRQPLQALPFGSTPCRRAKNAELRQAGVMLNWMELSNSFSSEKIKTKGFRPCRFSSTAID
jgi:hypothetical protein